MADKRAVFLDRDGVLNEDRGYAFKAEDVVLLGGVPEALLALKRRGFLLIVITNQSGVARGFFGAADVETFNAELRRQLRAQGIDVDDVFVCMHGPEEGCRCRKPKPGLIQDAATKHGIDLAASYFAGDKDSDMECAKAAGVVGVRISAQHSLHAALAQMP